MNFDPTECSDERLSALHKLTVVCVGRAELPEDDPRLGTYWTRRSVTLGRCVTLDAAITLAEQAIGQPPLTLFHESRPRAFSPEGVIMRDSESRHVLTGEISRWGYLVWFPPITSDDETYTLRAVAKHLRGEASFERGWDNYSTAEGLEQRAAFLEGHLVDPFWQAQVTQTLKLRAPLGLARRYSEPHETYDFDDAFDNDSLEVIHGSAEPGL